MGSREGDQWRACYRTIAFAFPVLLYVYLDEEIRDSKAGANERVRDASSRRSASAVVEKQARGVDIA